MSEFINLLQLLVLLFISKNLMFHDRHRYVVSFNRTKPRVVVWRLLWDYKDQCFYRDKIVIRF